MTDIKVVSGLNYGDESKGLVANALTNSNFTLFVMPSNSCQRAHTVVHNGIRKVFRHFGSGTLKGAATYFPKTFMVNPAMFREEYLELQAMGITPEVYYRTDGIVITPIDMFANSYLTKGQFCSTGCGVYEGFKRHNFIANVLEYNQTISNIIDYYDLRLRDANYNLDKKVEDFLYGPALIHNIQDDWEFFKSHVHLITSDLEEYELLHSFHNIIFENGQGLLLSDDYSFDFEDNTPAYVGAREPADIIKRNFNGEDVFIDLYYVTRSYYTRHGRGRIGVLSDTSCLRSDINPTIIDHTNEPNPWQGTLRYGKIDKNEAKTMLGRLNKDTKFFQCKVNKNIVITHMNEYYNEQLLSEAEMEPFLNIYLSYNESKLTLAHGYF